MACQRIRVTYARGEALRFLSHQDEFRMWERTLRRSLLPLAYKNGFNPQPHLQFAAPLGLGFSGLQERVDFRLESSYHPDEVHTRLTTAMPPGVVIHSLQEIDLKTPALASELLGADYSLLVHVPMLTDGDLRVARFLARTEIWRTRQRKKCDYRYNLRPLVHDLTYRGQRLDNQYHEFRLRVQMLEGATGRPDEVLCELGLSDHAHLLQRNRLYFTSCVEDQAFFASYTLVQQTDIAHPSHVRPGPSRRRRRYPRSRGRAPRRVSNARAQAFSEKAAEEFR